MFDLALAGILESVTWIFDVRLMMISLIAMESHGSDFASGMKFLSWSRMCWTLDAALDSSRCLIERYAEKQLVH